MNAPTATPTRHPLSAERDRINAWASHHDHHSAAVRADAKMGDTAMELMDEFETLMDLALNEDLSKYEDHPRQHPQAIRDALIRTHALAVLDKWLESRAKAYGISRG